MQVISDLLNDWKEGSSHRSWSLLSQKSGVPVSTISRIANGQSKSVRFSTASEIVSRIVANRDEYVDVLNRANPDWNSKIELQQKFFKEPAPEGFNSFEALPENNLTTDIKCKLLLLATAESLTGDLLNKMGHEAKATANFLVEQNVLMASDDGSYRLSENWSEPMTMATAALLSKFVSSEAIKLNEMGKGGANLSFMVQSMTEEGVESLKKLYEKYFNDVMNLVKKEEEKVVQGSADYKPWCITASLLNLTGGVNDETH